MLFTRRRIGKTGKDVGARELRKIQDDLIKTHARRQPTQHITDRDTRAADAWFSESSLKIDMGG
jgi:hypothetical protein